MINNMSYTYSNNYCQHRLPCGYCEKLGRDCPKQYTSTVTLNGTAVPAYAINTGSTATTANTVQGVNPTGEVKI